MHQAFYSAETENFKKCFNSYQQHRIEMDNSKTIACVTGFGRLAKNSSSFNGWLYGKFSARRINHV